MKSTVLLVATLVAASDALPEIFPTRLYHKASNVVARYVKGTQLPVAPATLNVVTSQGCFKSSGSLVYDSTPDWNTIGSCGNEICFAKGYAVGATTGGNQCWCGNEYPAKADLVDDKNCDVGCTGYGDQACGGIDFWTVYNTGKTLSVKYSGDDSSSSSSASKTASATSSATKPPQTVVVTAAPTETASSGGGSNTAGIVAGVVVGIVVIASAIGGGYLYMRRKRNKEIEEEHRRNAAVNAFVGKPPGSSAGSMTDSRMDPVMAHRRMSDGSIADNQDYSRRILRVTNA